MAHIKPYTQSSILLFAAFNQLFRLQYKWHRSRTVCSPNDAWSFAGSHSPCVSPGGCSAGWQVSACAFPVSLSTRLESRKYLCASLRYNPTRNRTQPTAVMTRAQPASHQWWTLLTTWLAYTQTIFWRNAHNVMKGQCFWNKPSFR